MPDSPLSLTRRKLLASGLAWGGLSALVDLSQVAAAQTASTPSAPASPQANANAPILGAVDAVVIENNFAADVAIDATSALLFSAQAPLSPAPGLRDARAVWSRVEPDWDGSVLLFFHGNNNYVTLDATGHSRVPDWATTPEAQSGAASKPAAPLAYGLNRMQTRRRPLVLMPEVGALATRSFWAREPAGQFTDIARLARLVEDCTAHLARLQRPTGPIKSRGKTYLSPRQARSKPQRICLSGHSGAGLPLEEAALSSLILPVSGVPMSGVPMSGVPADLWLFDCTYWSKVDGFLGFCKAWHGAGRLGGGKRDAARFVCVYRPKTQTEEIADTLRREIATILGVPAASLLQNHLKDNFAAQIDPVLQRAGVTFIATDLPHDDIPTFFLPALLNSTWS